MVVPSKPGTVDHIQKKLSDVDYVINTPGQWKSKRLCHVNMLKPYHSKDNPTTCRPVANIALVSDCSPDDSVNPSNIVEKSMKLHNSDVLLNLDRKLNHLPEEQRALINKLLRNLLTCSLMFQEGQLLLIMMLRWVMLIPSNSILTR